MYLGCYIGIVFILQEQRCSFYVILLGGNVKRWKADLPTSVILQ
jgi:hypothetical protein